MTTAESDICRIYTIFGSMKAQLILQKLHFIYQPSETRYYNPVHLHMCELQQTVVYCDISTFYGQNTGRLLS